MNAGGYEIERKYLIRYPDICVLNKKAESSDIIQTYLIDVEAGCGERVRERRYKDRTVFTYTVKTRISALRREERECEISNAEYLRLLRRADPLRREIKKTRFCLCYEGNLFEVDVYPFWQDRAIMEIELIDEKMSYKLPPDLVIISEVTEDERYTNAALAFHVPMDPIL